MGMGPLAFDRHVRGNSPSLKRGRVGQVRAAGRRSSPIGSSCWIVTSSVALPSPTRLPGFTFSSPIRPSIGAIHTAIVEVEPGIIDRALGPGDVGLGVFDVDRVVGLGLFEAGTVGIDLGCAFLRCAWALS